MDRPRALLLIAAAALLLFAGALGVRLHALLGATAASHAKVLCSARFVSGRSLESARRESLRLVFPGTRVEVEPTSRSVRVSTAGLAPRRAVFAGDQGCVALPAGETELGFEPVPVPRGLPPAESQPWPLGARDARAEPASLGVEPAALVRAVEAAFAPDARTAAFLVLHRGRIVAERYGNGADAHMPLESWSMGKSLTATLVGRLVQQGALALEDPAPIRAWREPGDPRREIRVAHLLRMSSGLHFSGPTRSLARLLLHGVPDHLRIYTGMDDVFRFAIERPLEHPPGRVGRYRNADPLVLGAVVRRIVEGRGERYLTWPQRALFDRIGARHFVLETDRQGNFLLTGYDYGTARDWARLGLLYLDEGVFAGERLLPETFVRFVAAPAPAWPEPVYGGLFWRNGDGRYPLPESAYFMAGSGVQRVFVVPSLDLVVVRLGHVKGERAAEPALARALERVVASLAQGSTHGPKEPGTPQGRPGAP